MQLPVDRTNYPTFALPEASVPESLLLVTMRLWRANRANENGQHQFAPDWRGGLAAVGLCHIAGDIVEPIFEYLTANGEASGYIGLHSCHLTDSELIFINSIAAIQHRHMDQVRLWLSGLIFPATARVMIALMTRLSAALEFRNLVLPDRITSVTRTKHKRDCQLH